MRSWPLIVVVGLVVGVGAWAAVEATGSAPPYRLLPDAAPGFAADPLGTGSLDLDAAAQATLMPAGRLRPQLRRDGFSGGRSRTWRSGDEFVEVAAFTLADARAAQALEQAELDYAAGLPGGGVHAGSAAFFSIPGLPAARGFVADGIADSGGAPLFVYGAWFTAGDRAYLVEDGSQSPRSVDFAQALARRQYGLVR